MKLNVTNRVIFGKQTKQLRNQGYVPCIIYGKHISTNIHMMVKKNEFIKTYRESGSSQVIDLAWDSTEMVLVHQYQKNPITDDVIHIDFLAVNANEVVAAEVSVKLIGVAPVDKDGIGKIELVRDHIRVQALPKDLPHHIEVDISGIATLEDGIFIKDINLGSKIEILDDSELAVVAAVALNNDAEEDSVVTPVAEATTP
jgi:large subunit ribosomal protein L25